MLFSYQLIIQLITQLRNSPFAGSHLEGTAEEGQTRHLGGFRLMLLWACGSLFLCGDTQ